MKALLGVIGLVVVLGMVSVLAKKQLSSAATPGNPQPTQQLPQQVKQQVEAALQQSRSIPDDK